MTKLKHVRMGIVALATLAGCTWVTQRSEAVLVDDFSMTANQQVSQSGAGTALPATVSMIPTNHTLGGSRTLTLDVSVGTGTSSLDVAVIPATASFVSDTDTQAVSMIIWDGNGMGLGDITVGGGDTFEATILQSNAGLGFTVDITDMAMNTATYTTVLGEVIPPSTDSVALLLGSFSNAGSVDFTNVKQIKLTLETFDGEDVVLGQVQIADADGPAPGRGVPEPATMSLLGLAGLAMLRRRGAKA